MANIRRPSDAELASELLQFTTSLDQLDTPQDVLDGLHKITNQLCQLSVLGALLFPVRWNDWSVIQKGKTVFLHKSLPEAWWDEYVEMSQKDPAPGAMMARLALAPFTMTETMRMLEPVGLDRWPQELALKYGMRDSLSCPVGGRWVVVYWSKNVLCERLTQKNRALLFMGATFVAIRLQKIIGPDAERVGKGQSLTPRELAVLRSMSVGRQIKETADYLGLGEETVRSHLKKAEAKFGVNSRTHAVAQAIRQRLIP